MTRRRILAGIGIAVLVVAPSLAWTLTHPSITHVRTNTVTQTQTVDVPTTPQSCTQAINDYKALASQLANVAGDYAGEISPAIQAVEDQSVTELDIVTAQVTGWNNQLSGLTTQAVTAGQEAGSCEGSG